MKQSPLSIPLGLAILLAVASTELAHAQNFGTNSGGTNTQGLFGQQGSFGRTSSTGTSGQNSGLFGGGGGGMSGDGNIPTTQNLDVGQFLGASTPQDALFSRAQGQSQNIPLDAGLQALVSQAAQREFQNQDSGRRIDLRSRVTLGFQNRVVPAAAFNEQMTRRLEKLPSLSIVNGVEVSLVNRTAILRGRVAHDYDANMIAQVVLLEPGVDNVQNNLSIGVEPPPAATDQTPDTRYAPPPLPDDPQLVPIAPPIPDCVVWDDAPPPAPTAPSVDN